MLTVTDYKGHCQTVLMAQEMNLKHARRKS